MKNNESKLIWLERVFQNLCNIFEDGVEDLMSNASCYLDFIPFS